MKIFIAKVSLRGSCCSNSRKAQKISFITCTSSGDFLVGGHFILKLDRLFCHGFLMQLVICAEGPVQDLPERFQFCLKPEANVT